VKDILVKEFTNVFDVGFTATMEDSLDKIEVGEADWVNVLKEFYTPFAERLAAVKHNIRDLKAANQTITGRMCPECNKFPLVIKWSKNGKFLACQGFPACRYTEPLEKVAPVTSSEVCDKCGAPMVVLTINGNRFLGCSRYPECKNTRSISTGVACPREGCTGQLIERKTRRGRMFFGCSAYPKCTYATWNRPVAKKCEKCGFPILVLKDTKKKGDYYQCPNCKEEYQMETAKETAETTVEEA
jgi:DNA topoisomerase I